MRIFLGLIALALVLASCGGKKRTSKNAAAAPFVVTDNEKAGIKEATDFYGGACNFTTHTDQPGNKRVADLEISKSKVLEQAVKITELNLSNIATIFYRDLQDERKNFDEVQVSVTLDSGRNVVRTYAASQLDMVLDKSAILTHVINLLKDQKYDSLSDIIDDNNGITHFNKAKLIHTIKSADSALGKVQSFVPYGFIIIKSDEGKDILHMSGLMVRNKNNNEFSIDVDPASTRNEAIFVNYKL